MLRRFLSPPADSGGLVAAAPSVGVRVLFKRFWPFARPYRKAILGGLALLVAVPAIEAAGIWLFKLVVDEVLVPGDLGPLLPIALAYLAFTIVGGLATFGDDYVAAWVGERFLRDVRTALYAHIQRLSPDSLDRRRLGDTVQRLTGDVQAIEGFVLTGVGEGVGALARLAFFGGALFLVSWKLALTALVVVPLFYGLARKFARLSKRAAREKRRRSGSLATVAEEGIANAALVRTLNRESAELDRFRRENTAIMEAELAATRIRAFFTPLVDLLELLGVLIVITVGTVLLADGEITLGGLLIFLAYLTQLYSPVRDLSTLSSTIFAAAAGGERVLEVLDEKPRIVDAPGALPLPHVAGLIEVEDVTYRYPGSATPALESLSLTIEPGERVAIVGSSGAGKSTLARLLMRFDDPTAGAIRIDGTDLRDVTQASIRDQVGLLLQESLIPDLSVRDVVEQGRPGASDEEVRGALEVAGAIEFVDALPQAWDTRVGQRGRLLSGGQRQRLAIARALVRDTPVLVLDEPTTGLDGASRDALLGPLGRLMESRTVILISHDPAVIATAHRVVDLEETRTLSARISHDRGQTPIGAQ